MVKCDLFFDVMQIKFHKDLEKKGGTGVNAGGLWRYPKPEISMAAVIDRIGILFFCQLNM